MTDVGDGWYRCSVVCVSGTTPMTGSGLFLRNTSYTSGAIQESWAASGTETINLWGAQLVEGTNALPYQKTETRLNIPRLDYSLGGCPNILLEPQRTNLALQSSSFDSATWSKTGITVTPNQGIAPDGTMTMDLITFDSAARATTQGISVTSGATYTFSVWLATQSGTQTVDIGNVNTSTFQSVTVTTTPQRFEVTQVASASTRYPAIRSTAAYSIFAWGAQLEAGAYATSYIPTTTAGVTRNQDLMLLSNIYTNNLLTSSGGTWFVDFRNNVPLSRDAQVRFGLGDTSAISLNSMYFVSGVTNGRLIIQKRVAGAVTTLYTTTADTCKIAFKWNGATMDIFENGFKVIADSVFTSTDLNFFNGIASTPFFINSMLLAPTPLTDAECIQLTTI
jgi:hypothetical protein